MKLIEKFTFLFALVKVLIPKVIEAKRDGVISKIEKAEFIALAVQEVIQAQCKVKIEIRIQEIGDDGCKLL